MINPQFRILFEESLAYKDAGLLASALKKRQEATALVQHDKGQYALGRACEAILLGYHIGNGVEAFKAAKESLKDMDAFHAAAEEWRQATGLNVFADILNIIRQWAPSYEEYTELNRLRVKWSPSAEAESELNNIPAMRKELPHWWRAQLLTAYNYYSRQSQEMDRGMYAQGMSILQCILSRAEVEESNYELEYGAFVHLLDDYIVIAKRHADALLYKYQKKHGQGEVPQDPGELLIVLKNVIDIWNRFAPDMAAKERAVFEDYSQVYWLTLAMVHAQDAMEPLARHYPGAMTDCPGCGKQIPKASPMCRYCHKLQQGAMPEMLPPDHGQNPGMKPFNCLILLLILAAGVFALIKFVF